MRFTLNRNSRLHRLWPGVAGVALSIAVAWCLLPVASKAADTIYFKDGMRTVCHGKAWEQAGEIHCEYDGGVLIYPKSQVVRIEKGPSTEPEAVAGEMDEAEKPQPVPTAVSEKPEMEAKAAPAPVPSIPPGIPFYDPRRSKRYWSSESRHHDSYQDAINALAEEFNKSPQWVEANMGESNDVLTIHANLTARIAGNIAATEGPAPERESMGVQFYNPRRAQKYWTGPDARHETFREAVETLAAEFKKSPTWVESHMGDSNDTEQIRQSLRRALKALNGEVDKDNAAQGHPD